MESNNNSNNSPIVKMIPVLVIFAGLLGLYYLYQYLFGPKMNNIYPLITATQDANVPADKPITFQPTALAPLYEGGEFTISTWIYISNWSLLSGQNKSIITIGGKNTATSFDTIRIYLGVYTPKLYVKLDTHESNPSGDATRPAPNKLDVSKRTLLFTATGSADSVALSDSDICNIPELPMQRWVNISVAVNAKVVDVYIDGKLSRSCVLPSTFKVDPSGYEAILLGYGGFGGKISTTTMYDVALNPEMVYKNYMAGPEPITSIGGWFSSFFEPIRSMS
jgi:hypothetical protein